MYLHGRNVLKEILSLDRKLDIKEVIFTDQENVDKQLEILKNETVKKGYRVRTDTFEKLMHLSREKKHQGVVINMRDFPYTELDDLLNRVSTKEKSVLVLLDQVQDPHNFGAIIRSSVAIGADGIIITTTASSEVTPAVVKVSTGLAFKIPIVQVVNMTKSVEKIKKQDFWVYAAAMEGDSYYDFEFASKAAIIFGNEGKGVRRLVKARSDVLVSIPMEAGVDSLNVAASAAILLFEQRRQRIKKLEADL